MSSINFSIYPKNITCCEIQKKIHEVSHEIHKLPNDFSCKRKILQDMATISNELLNIGEAGLCNKLFIFQVVDRISIDLDSAQKNHLYSAPLLSICIQSHLKKIKIKINMNKSLV